MHGGLVPVGVREEDLKAVAETDDADERHDAALEPAKAGEIEGEDGKDEDGGDEGGGEEGLGVGPAAGEEGGAEEEVEAEGGAEKFGEVGGDCGNFGGDPEGDGGAAAEVLATVLRKGEAGDNAELGREVLDEDGHGVRPEEDPEEAIAEAAATLDVGGEVAGIDVGDAGDEGGTEVGPHLVAAEAGEEAGAAGRKGVRSCGTGRGGDGSGRGAEISGNLDFLHDL